MDCILQFSNGINEALCLYSKPENLALGVIYRQPGNNANGHTSLNPQFIEMLNELDNIIQDLGEMIPDTIIGGDFNLPKVK